MGPWDAIGIPDMKRSRLRWMPDDGIVCGALDMTIRSLLEENDIDGTENTSDTDSIDVMIEAIQVTMAALREQAVARLGGLRKKRNELMAQPKLPLELMVNVLALSLEGRRYPLVRLAKLSTVSVGWWKTIRDTPSLWTGIPSQDPGASVALQRSQNLPLTAVLEDPGAWDPRGQEERQAIQQRHPLLSSQKHRWKSVRIHSDDEETFLGHFDQPLPMLKSMWLGTHEYPRIVLQDFQGGPRLVSMTLEQVQLPASSWTPSCVRNLGDLEISNVDLPRDWAERIVHAVVSNSQLSTLSLRRITAPPDEPTTIDTPQPAPTHLIISTLRTLHLLNVYPHLLHSLLRYIHGLSLRSLSIAGDDLHPTALLDAASPSLLRAVLDNNPPAVLHLAITDYGVRLLDSDSGFTLDPYGQQIGHSRIYGVSMRTNDWHQTFLRLVQVVDTATLSIPIHLHLLAKTPTLQDGADFLLESLPSLSYVAIHDHLDATRVLQALKTSGPKLRQVCLLCNTQTEELLTKAKELAGERPGVKVGSDEDGLYWLMDHYLERSRHPTT